MKAIPFPPSVWRQLGYCVSGEFRLADSSSVTQPMTIRHPDEEKADLIILENERAKRECL